MKKFLGTTMLALVTLLVTAQSKKSPVQGTVTESQTTIPVPGASIQLGDWQTVSDGSGFFRFSKINPGTYDLKITSIGFATHSQKVTIGNDGKDLKIQLNPIALFLQPLEVKAVRASEKAPFAKTTLSKEEIEKTNLGQDIPFLLNQTPSVVVNSDAGNGVGYTALRIRGTDATRINVTLNGIPYNDAESLGTYFVDLPDFASSLSSIQIQRGVGTSSNGGGAFGATLNLATNSFTEKAYAELNNSIGSFNTFKNTLKAGSGLIDGHFTVDARLSRITSDGYIARAKSDLSSFYVSTAYLNKRSSLRLNIFSGKEKTYQAWYGVPGNLLLTDRTNNPAGTEKLGSPYDNQTDNYTQTHYQLFFNHAINSKLLFSTAAFLTRGKGYYEEYKASQSFSKYGLPNVGTTTKTNLVRDRWLDNYYYGQIGSLQYKNGEDEFTLGGGWTKYDGKHYGSIAWLETGTIPPNFKYYEFSATKKDANLYLKWQHKLDANWTSFADLQYRHVSHIMNGFKGNPGLNVNKEFDFFNPKAGITYSHNGLQAYLSYALGNKEPNRDDFQTGLTKQPSAETLHDVELGFEKRTSTFHLGANLYYMYYVNQLVLTGQINDVGSYTRINIPRSYRLGIELQAGAQLEKWINVSANIAFSRNKVNSFTEYIDNYDNGGQNAVQHNNTDISFSPAVVAGGTLQLLPLNHLELNLISKYVSKQYMDNTQQENRSLNAYFTEDIRASWTINRFIFGEWHIIGQVNNLFNKKYEPNGYTYSYISSGSVSTDNGYYPMAGTNFMLGVNIRL